MSNFVEDLAKKLSCKDCVFLSKCNFNRCATYLSTCSLITEFRFSLLMDFVSKLKDASTLLAVCDSSYGKEFDWVVTTSDVHNILVEVLGNDKS